MVLLIVIKNIHILGADQDLPGSPRVYYAIMLTARSVLMQNVASCPVVAFNDPALLDIKLRYCAALNAGSADWRSIDDAPSQPASITSTTPATSPVSHNPGCGR